MLTSICRVTVADEWGEEKSVAVHLKDYLGFYLEAPTRRIKWEWKLSAGKESGISAYGAGSLSVSLKHSVSTLKQTKVLRYGGAIPPLPYTSSRRDA
jgi:hypothetical protein